MQAEAFQQPQSPIFADIQKNVECYSGLEKMPSMGETAGDEQAFSHQLL
jgi:hypothetical protein